MITARSTFEERKQFLDDRVNEGISPEAALDEMTAMITADVEAEAAAYAQQYAAEEAAKIAARLERGAAKTAAEQARREQFRMDMNAKRKRIGIPEVDYDAR